MLQRVTPTGGTPHSLFECGLVGLGGSGRGAAAQDRQKRDLKSMLKVKMSVFETAGAAEETPCEDHFWHLGASMRDSGMVIIHRSRCGHILSTDCSQEKSHGVGGYLPRNFTINHL